MTVRRPPPGNPPNESTTDEFLLSLRSFVVLLSGVALGALAIIEPQWAVGICVSVAAISLLSKIIRN